MVIEGIRRYHDKFGFLRLPDGGYGQDISGKWYCRPPEANTFDLRSHTVMELVDGRATVTQVIVSSVGSQFNLDRGMWSIR